MKLALVLLMYVTSAFTARVARWVNEYDRPLYFQCGNHQSISTIISIHDNDKEDRVWDFSCKNTFNHPTHCSWSGYVNDFDQWLQYICPFGSVLSGMNSYHDNDKEDRRWSFLCCAGEAHISWNCEWTNYVNDFDRYLRWDAPYDRYLVGTSSYHDNDKEDRRWRFYTCQKS